MAALALAACGDSEDDAQELNVELKGGQSAKFSAPATAEPGEAQITFKNATGDEAELQLIRVEGNHDAEEVVKALGGASSGKPFPDWFFAGGGVSGIEGGKSRTVTQILEPGTYYTTNLEGKPDPSSFAAIKVSGEADDAELESDKTVTAAEYKFEADGLEAGENEVAFENVGAQPHHLIVAKLKDGATFKEVQDAIKTNKGEPPLEEEGGDHTAVIEGGETQLVELNLEPGTYAMMCFISDRQGGPPHAVKGMVNELEIE
ncbi:MAG TPA: plastocyanin/azurin family copper-binding protein [Solirubrobacterales bacterium]